MSNPAGLSASLEDYLEAIYEIVSEKGGVRAKDIADRLSVRAGSVTGALQALAEKKYINYAPYEVITLTEQGQQQARRIIRKHEVLKDFFVEILGIAPEVAEEGACQAEHVICDELIDRLVNFAEFLQVCPRCGDDWLAQYRQQCTEGIPKDIHDCHACIEQTLKDAHGQQMKSQGVTVTLQDVPVGDKCVVKRINRKAAAMQRLVEMGISRGAVVEVERVAPLGDPIEVKVKGYHLSIRKEEAAHIEVQQ
ncbi:MAG: metal-dependent transcriptional regulator [Planctomycetota bacterium]|jgi:DtxR family Mn-dependent transcriptional regulator